MLDVPDVPDVLCGKLNSKEFYTRGFAGPSVSTYLLS